MLDTDRKNTLVRMLAYAMVQELGKELELEIETSVLSHVPQAPDLNLMPPPEPEVRTRRRRPRTKKMKVVRRPWGETKNMVRSACLKASGKNRDKKFNVVDLRKNMPPTEVKRLLKKEPHMTLASLVKKGELITSGHLDGLKAWRIGKKFKISPR